MARLATEADFHGGRHREARRAAGPPPLYDEYRRFPFFAERAAAVRARYPDARRVLVVGCGYGYLVDELRRAGVPDPWGVDASPWAVERAAAVLPGASARRVRLADATDAASLAAALPEVLRRDGRFDVAVTEDVLPVLDPGEQRALLAAVRARAAAVLHVVTPGDPADPAKLPGPEWRSIEAWRALLGAGEPVLDAETGEAWG